MTTEWVRKDIYKPTLADIEVGMMIRATRRGRDFGQVVVAIENGEVLVAEYVGGLQEHFAFVKPSSVRVVWALPPGESYGAEAIARGQAILARHAARDKWIAEMNTAKCLAESA